MERKLFSFDEAGAASEIKKLESIKDKIQIVIDRCIELVPNASFTLEEIEPFIFPEYNILGVANYGSDIPRQIKILIGKKIVEKSPMKQMPIDPETIIDSLKLPDTGKLESAFQEARIKIGVFISHVPINWRAVDNPMTVLHLVKNKVEFTHGSIEAVNEAYKKYIETEEQLFRLEKAKKVADSLNEAVETGTGGFTIANPGDIGYIVEIDETGKFKPAWSFINFEY